MNQENSILIGWGETANRQSFPCDVSWVSSSLQISLKNSIGSNYAKLSKFFPESIFLALCFSSGERHSSSTYNKVGLFLKDKGEFCPKIKYVLEG